MKKKLISILATVVATTTILTACGSKSQAKKDTASSAPDKTQVFNVVGYDYSTLDVNLGADQPTATTTRNVDEGLYRDVSENGVQKSVPAIAEKTEISSDGLVYTFHLRKDAKWSDGKAVTADQFEYSWKRLIDPKVASPYATLIDMVKGAEEYRTGKGTAENVGVKAVDDNTFQVTLKAPCGYFEKMLSFSNLSPVRKDLVEAQGEKYGSDYKTMVYNGPFVVDSYQKGSKIVYKKNDNYWDKDNVKLTEANGIIYNEPSVGTKMFENKELDIVGAIGEDLAKLKSDAKSGKYDEINGYTPGSFYMDFNLTTPALKNAKVRQALSLAINREEFLNVVFKRNVPSLGLVPKAVDINGKLYRDQVEEPLKALSDSTKDIKTLFQEGLKESGVDASNLKLNLLFSVKSSKGQVLTEYIQKTYKEKLGLDIDIVYSVDAPSYYKDMQSGKFDMVLSGWAADYDDPATFFQVFNSKDGNNYGKYSNAEYDKIIKEANDEVDQAKRVDLYKKAEKIVVADDPAMIPLYYQDVNTFTQKYVKNYFVPNTNGLYDLKSVYISGKN